MRQRCMLVGCCPATASSQTGGGEPLTPCPRPGPLSLPLLRLVPAGTNVRETRAQEVPRLSTNTMGEKVKAANAKVGAEKTKGLASKSPLHLKWPRTHPFHFTQRKEALTELPCGVALQQSIYGRLLARATILILTISYWF